MGVETLLRHRRPCQLVRPSLDGQPAAKWWEGPLIAQTCTRRLPTVRCAMLHAVPAPCSQQPCFRRITGSIHPEYHSFCHKVLLRSRSNITSKVLGVREGGGGGGRGI